MSFSICDVDWSLQTHAEAVAECIASYMADPMGDMPVHSPLQREMLLNGLKYHPKGIYFLAFAADQPAGCIICFENFSTFHARPVINIHDLIVNHAYRGIGIGRILIQHILAEAENRNCAKVTLEVREDNGVAQRLYESEGFTECSPPMKFWVRML